MKGLNRVKEIRNILVDTDISLLDGYALAEMLQEMQVELLCIEDEDDYTLGIELCEETIKSCYKELYKRLGIKAN